MRIYIFLLLVFVGRALALSRYKRESGGISFSDGASVSAGLDGINGNFKKSIGVKVPRLLNIFGSSDESDNNEIGLNIDGGIGLNPKLSFGEDGGGFGISLGGSSGLDIGMSGNNKRLSEKGYANEHDKSKKHHKSSEESNISGIWGSISHSLSGDASIHKDHKTSLGGGKSADLDGGISIIGVTGRKHDHKHGEHESHKEHHNNDNESKGHQGSAKTNGPANEDLEEKKNDYWNEGEIIVIPISDRERSDRIVGEKSQNNNGKAHFTKKNRTDNGEKDDVNIGGVIIIPFGDSEESGKISSNGNEHNSESKHNNDGKKKGENGSNHIEGKGSITISHGKGGQSSDGDKGHNNGNGHGNSHVKEGDGIIKSHREHQNDHNGSKGHQESSNKNENKNGRKKGEHEESATISHGDGGQFSDGDKGHNNGNGHSNSHVKEGDGIIKSHREHQNDHNGSKGHQKSSNKNENKNGGKKGEHEESATISYGDGEQSNDKKHYNGNRNNNRHIKERGDVIISHAGHQDGHNGSKGHQGSSKGTEFNNDGKKEENSSIHDKNGQSGGHVGSGNNHEKRENTNHSNERGVNMTTNGHHDNGKFYGKNSTKHGSLIDGKESKNYEKSNGHLCNYGELLNTGKCGSNIEAILRFVQTFIHNLDTVVYFLLELKDNDLRRLLCQVSPHDSKFSCQLGCNIPRVRPISKHF